ncbi:MAG: UbiA family prenyltransferase [Candidatus Altiarchaeota archaeon]
MDILAYLTGFYRIKDWVHLLGLGFIGLSYSSPFPPDDGAILACGIVSSLYLAFGYSSNTLFEEHMGKSLGCRQLLLSMLPAAVGLAFSYHLSPPLAFLYSIGVLFGILYSAPPVMAKGMPVIELFFNSLLFTLIFLFGVVLGGGSASSDVLFFSAFIFIMVIPFQLVQELTDMDHDASKGIKTTAVHMTPKAVRLMMVAAILVILLFSVVMPPWVGLDWRFTVATILFGLSFLPSTRMPSASGNADYGRLRIGLRYAGIAYGLLLVLLLSIKQGF